MSDKSTKTLTLNRGAIRILQQLLSSLQWYTETSDAYRAGALLEDPAMELPEQPAINADLAPAAQRAEAKAWMGVDVELPVRAKQIETLKRCVQHYSQKGALPPGPYTNRLLDELGLTPED